MTVARRAGSLFAVAVLASCSGGSDRTPALPIDPPPPARSCPPARPAIDPASPTSTLVLYDDDAPYGWLGESYATLAGHLASHFGNWAARPVRAYQGGDMRPWGAAVYVGSFFDAPLPGSFLDDVLAGGTPVVWLGYNVWQLEQRDPTFSDRFGFTTGSLDPTPITTVHYKGRDLTRSPDNMEGVVACDPVNPATVGVLAAAVRLDGSTLPWALRSGDLTYIAENPLSYMTESDRYLAFADLLFDALAPATSERHRALVRIEDVTPAEDPERLRAIGDLLYELCVPFSVAVVPRYADPLGTYSIDGQPEFVLLRDSPVADALAYMVARGGELVLHGYTHQYAEQVNPYSGVSADDFEFWSTHVDAGNFVVYDGPVAIDSEAYARDRVLKGIDELAAAGLPAPIAFEYPHYAGSALDSFAIGTVIPTAYHRGFYFPGMVSGAGADLARPFGQLFPYVVTDVYGWRVIPENIGNYQPVAYNAGVGTRLVEDLVRNAEANLVVRDGVASFFFHPYFEPEILGSIVTGLKGLGYEFVSAGSL